MTTFATRATLDSLVQILSWKRFEGTESQREFCTRYLEPVFGPPDPDGNYIYDSGHNSRVCFMAHHDTVHKGSGKQKIGINKDGHLYSKDSNCLGADDGTGIWLILEMIRARVPGLYIIHAGEEHGCIGSSALARKRPEAVNGIDCAISLDRKGTDSIITHQMGSRTCSDEFAWSLANILGSVGANMSPDPTGSFTDSNEYAHIIHECTNLSVGYYNQHSKIETQDPAFALRLLDALVKADWAKLRIIRDPLAVDYGSLWENNNWAWEGNVENLNINAMERIIAEDPRAVAELLDALGYDAGTLRDEI